MAEQPARRRSDSEQISNEIVVHFKEYVGRGPTAAWTHITPKLVVCVLSDTLTKAERTLVAGGHGDEVRSIRRRFQETMRTDLIAVVESRLQRKVLAFMSDHSIEPDMASEVFVLADPE